MDRNYKSKVQNNNRGFVQVIFVCDLELEAGEVFLAGSFSNWNSSSDRMHKVKGHYQKIKRLSPGEYQYKFVVDGKWHTDPNSSSQVSNEYGGVDSVIKV